MKVPLLNFVGGPGVPLLNFEGGPGVPLLNFEGGPGVPSPRVLVAFLHHAHSKMENPTHSFRELNLVLQFV